MDSLYFTMIFLHFQMIFPPKNPTSPDPVISAEKCMILPSFCIGSPWFPPKNPLRCPAFLPLRGQVASFLLHCQDASGGFAGGPQQLPHLAPTYAAVSALMVAGTEEAYKVPKPEDLKMTM